MQLFERDSAVDLLCRGFKRDEILSRAGVDVGYNGNAMKAATRGVDREEYKFAFVAATTSRGDFVDYLERYGDRTWTRGDVFEACGLARTVRVSLETLSSRMGCESEYATACEREMEGRDDVRRRTNRARFGADYPTQLPEFVERVRETTIRNHGGVGRASPEIRARMESTMIARYGSVEDAMSAAREKARETLAERRASRPPREKKSTPRVPKRVVETWTDGDALFDEDSPRDLFCRGFSRAEILDRAGVDCGYHGVELGLKIPKSDRVAYAASAIRERVGVDAMRAAMSTVRSKAEFLAAAGFSSSWRGSVEGVCARLGLQAEYDAMMTASYADRTAASRATMLARYGCEGSLQSPELVEKIKRTMRDRYGVEHASQSRELRERQQATMQERYGARVSSQSEMLRRKAVDTWRARYGVENPMQSEAVKRKVMDTNLKKYGVRYSIQADSVRRASEATMLAKYGTTHALQVPDVQMVARETMLARYGVDSAMRSAALRDKARSTLLSRYGVTHNMRIPECVSKSLRTKAEHGTFSSSEPEESLHKMLVETFGEDDVTRQFVSGVYPFACDFYVKSRDLYLELNGFLSHGGHWFGSAASDAGVLVAWRDKNSKFYDNQIDVWTRRDVAKREAARRNNLNYVVFWDPKLADAELWFAMGCPDGRDWEREYSWLPDPGDELVYDGVFPETLSVGAVRLNRAVKAAVWPEFYKRERALWAENYDSKWGTVRARLYANRFKYLNKLPGELTGREILRGLNISGMVDGYSSFDAAGMLEFLDIYDPRRIHDPCAGWGERLAVCAVRGVEYLGVDVNSAVVAAHGRLIARYGLRGVETRVGDSASLSFASGSHDCVFTCPPYGSREIYTPEGAENLSSEEFDAWWRRVVENVTGPSVRVFAYQVDLAHRDAMNAALVDAGWTLDRQIPVGVERVSHMIRASGATRKRNFEEVQVFVR